MTKINKRESSNIDSWKYFKLEPPKIYYFISEDGDMWSEEDLDGTLELKRKNIGNYFESEKEVRKAYKKLMAWKRLKDKGFRFYGWNKGSLLKNMPNNITFACDDTRIWAWEDIREDLDLLFSGEDN